MHIKKDIQKYNPSKFLSMSEYNRSSELQAFDDTKAGGVKGLVEDSSYISPRAIYTRGEEDLRPNCSDD